MPTTATPTRRPARSTSAVERSDGLIQMKTPKNPKKRSNGLLDLSPSIPSRAPLEGSLLPSPTSWLSTPMGLPRNVPKPLQKPHGLLLHRPPPLLPLPSPRPPVSSACYRHPQRPPKQLLPQHRVHRNLPPQDSPPPRRPRLSRVPLPRRCPLRNSLPQFQVSSFFSFLDEPTHLLLSNLPTFLPSCL